jgi:hypothetical protein
MPVDGGSEGGLDGLGSDLAKGRDLHRPPRGKERGMALARGPEPEGGGGAASTANMPGGPPGGHLRQTVTSLFCQEGLSPGGNTGKTQAAMRRRCVQLVPDQSLKAPLSKKALAATRLYH